MDNTTSSFLTSKIKGTWAHRSFLALALIILAEPVASTMLFPFVYFMVQDFGYSESEAGLRAGIIG